MNLKIIKPNPRLFKPVKIAISYEINKNGHAEIGIISDAEIAEQKEVLKNIQESI